MAESRLTFRPALLLAARQRARQGSQVGVAAAGDELPSTDAASPPGRGRCPSFGTAASVRRRLARWAQGAALMCLVAALCAAPWLRPELVGCGWLGVAGALWLATSLSARRALCMTAGWTILAIAAAFHWSPEVLAYTMESDYPLGVAVFVPLVLWEAARATLPFWLAGRLARNAAAAWLPAGLCAVILEFFLPTVFPCAWATARSPGRGRFRLSMCLARSGQR